MQKMKLQLCKQFFLLDNQLCAVLCSALLDRGYTGHEHLQSVGLIHMNGRLYDAKLHRFLQPDNNIQDPYNTQNHNRYSYVLNNPLKYNDPSGEWWNFVAAAVIAYFSGVQSSGGEYNPTKWNSNTWTNAALGAASFGASTLATNASNNYLEDYGNNANLAIIGGNPVEEHPYVGNNQNNFRKEIPYSYRGAGYFEYTDEVLAGITAHAKGLKNGGGYVALSTAESGSGLYWKPNARGLNNLKGTSFNVSSGLNYGAWGVSAALEVPEIYYGYQTNTHEGNKQVAGAVGNLGGGWLGGIAAGATIGFLTTWETGPFVILGVFGGAVAGSYYGEEGMELIYEEFTKPRHGTVKGTITTAMPVW